MLVCQCRRSLNKVCSCFICGPSSPPHRPSSRVSYLPSPSSSSSHSSPRHLQIQRQRCSDAGSGWRCGWEEIHCYGDFSFPFVSTCPARRMKGNWFCCLQCVAASFFSESLSPRPSLRTIRRQRTCLQHCPSHVKRGGSLCWAG